MEPAASGRACAKARYLAGTRPDSAVQGDSPVCLITIVLQEHDNFYLIPRRDGHILAGSTLEEAGFDKASTAEAREHCCQRRTHSCLN